MIARGTFLRFVRRGAWEYVERVEGPLGVAVVAVSQNRLILVEQFRPPLGRRVIEIPSGLVGDAPGQEEESLEEGARRELLEETGYQAGRLELLTQGPQAPGVSSDVVAFYRAHELEKIGPGGGEEDEEIVVHEVPLSELHSWLRGKVSEGCMADPRIFLGLYFLERDA